MTLRLDVLEEGIIKALEDIENNPEQVLEQTKGLSKKDEIAHLRVLANVEREQAQEIIEEDERYAEGGYCSPLAVCCVET